MSVKRILIVDDEAPMRHLLSKQLGRAGFETITAADGEAALAAAVGPLSDAPSFDAVVLDVVMPGIDGFEVCRRLKADPQTADIPVIFLSASCSGEFRRRAFSVGASDFLAKPFQTHELPVYIKSILRRAENESIGRAATDPVTTGLAATGHIISVIGANRAASAATTAVRLAETAALQGPGPAMLIDLELPAGSIGARLQLSGGPNMRVLLQDTDEPVSVEAIGRVAQRYHGAMEVIPAPFSPSLISQVEPAPERLVNVLDILKQSGYYVVIHLGTEVNDLTRIAMNHSETIWAASVSEMADEHGTLLADIAAAGIAQENILPAPAELIASRPIAFPTTAHSRSRAQPRSPEPAIGQLAVIA